MSEEFQATLERVAGEHGVGPLAPESPPNNVGAAGDSAFEASLRENVNRVVKQGKQEKQAARTDPAEAGLREQVKSERLAREAEEKRRGARDATFVGVKPEVEDSMRVAMARAQRKAAEKEAVAMPSRAGQTLDERIRAAMEWRQLPMDEKRLVRGSHDHIAGERAAAESLGLSYEEAKAAETAKRIEVNDQLSPLLAEWERDPAGTFVRFGREHNLIPQMTPERHQQYQAAAAAATASAVARAVEGVVDQFAAQVPDFDRYQGVMEEALANGWVARTGHWQTDLVNAYHFAKQHYA